MTTIQPSLARYLLPAASLFGVLALGGGVYGLANPAAWSETLGIPVTSTSSPAIPFLSFIAARNLASGITLLTYGALGQRKAAGIHLMVGMSASLADAWICNQYGGVEGKAVGHAVMGVLVGTLGAGLSWS